ncbi:MAG: hypothetical protein AAF527_11600 [Pseudomonadota bacterium]
MRRETGIRGWSGGGRWLGAWGAFWLVAALAASSSASAMGEKGEAAGPLPPPAPDIVIGLDASDGAPLTKSDGYARAVGARLGEMVGRMRTGGRVHVRVFGAEGAEDVRLDLSISPGAQAEEVAQRVQAMASVIPRLVYEETLTPRRDTKIMAFTEAAATDVASCEARAAQVVIVTDGFEASAAADLRRGDTLPPPIAPRFAPCAGLAFIGLDGPGASAAQARRLRRQWGLWSDAAGFPRFDALPL